MEEKIKEMFEKGLSSKEIETELGITYQKVKRVLSGFGIDVQEVYKSRQETKYVEALRLYESGMQFKKICKLLGAGPNQLRPYLKEHCTKWRTQSESLIENMDDSEDSKIKMSTNHRKYDIDDNAFDDLTKEEVAYWFGFLYADGSIRSTGYTVCIGLAEKDYDHLVKLCEFLKTPKERISYVHSSNSFSLVFTSYKIYHRLKELGFTSNKSYDAKPPEELEGNRHFWRGVIDGDGSLHYSYKDYKGKQYLKFAIGICGTYDTVSNFKDWLYSKSNLLTNRKIEIKENGFSILDFKSKHDFLFISDLLYKDSNIYLERKFKKYLEIREKLLII